MVVSKNAVYSSPPWPLTARTAIPWTSTGGLKVRMSKILKLSIDDFAQCRNGQNCVVCCYVFSISDHHSGTLWAMLEMTSLILCLAVNNSVHCASSSSTVGATLLSVWWHHGTFGAREGRSQTDTVPSATTVDEERGRGELRIKRCAPSSEGREWSPATKECVCSRN